MQASASLSNHIGLKGRLRIWRLRDSISELLVDLPNLYTNAGRVALAALLTAIGVEPTHVAIGTGTTAAAIGDTTLEAEQYRGAAVRSIATTLVANDTARYIAELNILAAHDITEAGLFNAVAADSLFCRQVFAAVEVISGDIIRVTWDLYS